MKSECENLRSEIERQPSGQAWSEALKARVRNHLDTCDKCRAELLVEASIADSWAATYERPAIDDGRVIERIRATLEGKETTRAGPLRQRIPRAGWWVPVGLAAAACIALVWLWPSGSNHGGLITMVTATRETDATLGSVEYFGITVEVTGPVYIRLAVRDSKGEVRLAPANPATSTAEPISGRWEGRVLRSCPSDADCLRTHVMVLACSSPLPETSEVIVQVAGDAEEVTEDLLRNAGKAIKKRFGCEVRALALR